VWIVRHGQSESNAGLATQSAGSADLTARGVAQAARVAAAIPERPGLLVTSPYVRARRTAEPAAARFPGVPLEEWPVEEFTYLAAANRAGSDNETRRPLVRAFWERSDPHFVDGEGAESFAAFLDRIHGTLARLALVDAPFTVVFAHGLFLRVLLWLVLVGKVEPTPAAMAACRAFASGVPTPNACIAELRFDGTRVWTTTPRVDHLPGDLIDPLTWDPAE
jgi:probable phosphoglycerate mutase